MPILSKRWLDVDCEVVPVGGFDDPWCLTHNAYRLDCLQCGRLFHSARPHTRFCTNACRQRAYRARNRR